MMLSAKQAKDLSVEGESIMEEITKAALEGSYSLTIFKLSSPMKKALESLGYTIESFSGGLNETNYKIKW